MLQDYCLNLSLTNADKACVSSLRSLNCHSNDAVVVAQLAEQSISPSENPGSNPTNGILYAVESWNDDNKEKESVNGPFKKDNYACNLNAQMNLEQHWDLNSWVVSLGSDHQYAAPYPGPQVQALVTTNSFLDPSTTSMLSSWFYLVDLIWYYHLSVKFVNCETEHWKYLFCWKTL